MALSRSNPLDIQVLEDNTPQLGDQVDRIMLQVREADKASHTWQKKQLNYMKSRFGKRRKRTVPWKGASNINVPLVDGIVRRWRPGIAALVLDANPVAFFSNRDSADFESARQIEQFFTWLTIDNMKIAREVIRLTTLISERGHAYSREGWKYETEARAEIALAEHIFPGGVGAFLKSAQQEQIDKVIAGIASPEEAESDLILVARHIAEQYDMDIEEQAEGQTLIRAAQAVMGGAASFKIIRDRVKHDRPDWKAVDPLNVIAPDIDDPAVNGDFLCVIHSMSTDQIQRMALDGHWPEKSSKELVRKMQDKKSIDTQGGDRASSVRQQIESFKQRKDGINRLDTARARTARTDIWEVFCRLDFGGGIRQRAQVWYAPSQDLQISASEYIMPFDEWPLTTFLFDAGVDRPFASRGIPEMLSELQRLVNAFHNARIDASQILLAPVMQQRAAGSSFAQSISWRPGAIIPVSNVGDIAPIPQDLRILTALLQEEQVSQRTAENFVGTFDATINQLQQPTERRTATEITAITNLAQNVFGLDARTFQESMGRSFDKIWKLWQAFGEETTYFRVMGEEQPQMAKKSEMLGNYDVKPAGTPTSTNKAFLLSSMERILQIVINDQSGRFDVGTLLSNYFKLIDYNLAKDVVRSPEDTQAAQQVMQAAQAVTGEQAIF